MPIFDVAGNAFPGGVAKTFLGFTATTPTPGDTVDIYDFVLGAIREADQSEAGAYFLRRYLDGPQEAWTVMETQAKSLPSMWNPTTAPAEVLPFLAWIVGWTREFKDVIDVLDELTLRRLIISAAALWDKAGSADSWQDVARLVAGARSRVWDWFFFRNVLGETGPGEQHDGLDMWLIENDHVQQSTSNLRIVDDGTVPHDAILAILSRMRPMGERIEVSWIGALSLFDDTLEVDVSVGLWSVPVGALTVANGRATSAGATTAFLRRADMAFWKSVVAFARMRAPAIASNDFGIVAFYRSATNLVTFTINPSTNVFTIARKSTVLGNVTVATGSLPGGITIQEGVFYGLRLEAVPEGAGYRYRAFIDATLCASAFDADAAVTGPPGLISEGVVFECDEVEAHVPPLITNLVGPGV